MNREGTLAAFVQDAKPEYETPVLEENLNPTICKEASYVAFGMLALGDAEETQLWFKHLAPYQAETAVIKKDGKVELNNEEGKQYDARDLSWLSFHDLALFGSPTGDSDVLKDTGETLYEHATDPVLEELGGLDRTSQPYYVAAFGALYLQRNDVGDYCQKARERLSERNSSRTTLYRTLVNAIEAIAGGDEGEIEDALHTLLNEYHVEDVVGNDVGFPLPIQRVSREATALVALARTHGIDVHVDSEYVPDALYDEDHYPLGGD